VDKDRAVADMRREMEAMQATHAEEAARLRHHMHVRAAGKSRALCWQENKEVCEGKSE
jgi:hypothetical protein